MRFVYLWIFASIIYVSSGAVWNTILFEVIFPLLFCTIMVYIFQSEKYVKSRILAAYFLYFSVSVFTYFDLVSSLTGSHRVSKEIQIFGWSFYTISLAYLFINKKTLTSIDAFKISNPLLLSTGPVALFITNYSYRKFYSRVKYYLPFVILGVFFYQVIGIPLIPALTLVEKTDLFSSIIFATIFELFVYANFCGLSLILYGLFGIAGYKIPLNFKQPFSCTNLLEFWRGWHISLSAVLKILFYLPVRQKFSPNVAIIVVFFASAMWHGVTVSFLIWGLFHALMFIFTLYSLKYRLPILPLIFLLASLIIGRMIFADTDIDKLLLKLTFSYEGFGVFNELKAFGNTFKVSLFLGFGIIMIEFFFQNTKLLRKRNYKHLRTPFSLVIIATLTILFISNEGVGFAVYGQR